MTGTPKDPAEIAALDQMQAEARLGVDMLYTIFKPMARSAPDLVTAKQFMVAALEKVHAATPWTPEELMHALAEAFAMLYRAETRRPSGSTSEEGSPDA